MHLEAPTSQIKKPRKEVYDFLADLRNFENLMPDSIQTFEVLDPDTFRFALKGMPEIVLKRKSQTPHEKMVLGAASDKLPFSLTADLKEVSPDTTEVALSFEGEFNAMMAMMVKGPITKFLGTLSEKLSGI